MAGIQPAPSAADVLYEVVFDSAFPGGLTLGGEDSAGMGYRLYWSAFLNLSAESDKKVPFFFLLRRCQEKILYFIVKI